MSKMAFGIDSFDAALEGVRRFYRAHPLVEVFLLAIPATTHISLALSAMYIRFREGGHTAGWRMKLHRFSGYFLMLAIVGHVFATRFAPTFGTGGTATGKADFSFLAYSMLNWGWFFAPYYLLLGTAGAIHLCLGLSLAAKILLPHQVPTDTSRKIGNVMAGFMVLFVLAGVISLIRFSPAASHLRFEEFAALYQRFAPFLHPSVK